jgi:hypothetical protein
MNKKRKINLLTSNFKYQTDIEYHCKKAKSIETKQ